MRVEDLALQRRYPGLRVLPRWPCLTLPTPVEGLSLPGVPPDRLFVKRDDRSCPVYGGSKPRKLEGILGAALARGSGRLVTAGALGTHHGLATALLSRRAHLETSVVLVDQPWTEHVEAQLRRLAASGAEIEYGRTLAEAGARIARIWARATWRGERPLWVPVGGSSPAGVVGFVSAAFELAEQIDAGACPPVSEIYVAVGSGGTLAGLTLGARLAGLATRIVGVLVTDLLPPNPRRLARLARATNVWLRRLDPTVPIAAIGPRDFRLARGQLGPGYGASTPAARRAQRDARQAGLALEVTYTAKCLAEVRARIASGHSEGPFLFWNTFASEGDAPPAKTGRPSTLPRALRTRLGEAAAAGSLPAGADPATPGEG